ncbi:MAG TPA: transposase, partial [Oligoflexus sp.]|uniref:transposase n=1 Tax=Oligoflexus sp. TaxID=1971216 RepID=UPI002D5C484D
MKRKSYSPEFKAKVALKAIKGGLTANEIGAKYEVHPVQISQWKKELLENTGSIFEGKQWNGPAALKTRQPTRSEAKAKLIAELPLIKTRLTKLQPDLAGNAAVELLFSETKSALEAAQE